MNINQKIEQLEAEFATKIADIKKELSKGQDWVKIDYSIIPKEVFDRYGAKPFEIMKNKMRNDKGNVWNNINYFEAKKECEKLGGHLPTIQEMLVLLEWYKTKNQEVSCHDKEFLGIEELSYDEDVNYEWIGMLKDVAFLRGGYWSNTSYAGVFTLTLDGAPTSAYTTVGFRACKEI
jgi:formylglycine-generating enzyme required for sulfatase activity